MREPIAIMHRRSAIDTHRHAHVVVVKKAGPRLIDQHAICRERVFHTTVGGGSNFREFVKQFARSLGPQKQRLTAVKDAVERIQLMPHYMPMELGQERLLDFVAQERSALIYCSVAEPIAVGARQIAA